MAARDHVEIERKYQVEDLATVPLSGVDTDPRAGAVSETQLDAVYFDTRALDLHRRGITLRRRTGGDDEGWHVKIPRDPDQKTEIRHPLGRAVRTVPRKVVDPVRAIVRDQPLVPVATITTHRTTYTLLNHGERAAMLCDDRVSARSLLDDQDEHVWREWELEVVEGQPPGSVFASFEPTLLDAGAHRADHRSKLGRVLAHHGQDQPLPGPKRGRRGRDERTAGEAPGPADLGPARPRCGHPRWIAGGCPPNADRGPPPAVGTDHHHAALQSGA